METATKWYEKTGLVIIFLITFFPLGLFGLWKSNKISNFWKIGVTALFVLVIVAALSEDKDTSKEATEINYNVSPSDCYVMSQNFIKLTLKSPKSADFPAMDFNHSQTDSVTHVISSYVDAVNSFNAEIRTYYTITMKFNGGDWYDQSNWSVIDLQTK